MGFRHGTVSYARFRVNGGKPPTSVDAALIEALAEHTLRPPSVGAPPEMQAGWCAGRHVFDATFDAETIAYGDTLLFGMRLDTNRVPADIRRAYRALAESAHAATSPTGFLNRAERQSAREEAESKCREDLARGMHRTSALVPVLWDLRRKLVLAPVFSDAKVTALADLFSTTFDCTLEPLTAGAVAREHVAAQSGRRDYEDARPSAFTPAPSGAGEREGEAATPLVPWTCTGPEPKDFLGNELLIWLWRQCAAGDDVVETDRGEVAVAIDRVLDMDCAWEVTGRQSLRADGPSRLPEAAAALRHGKWPRKAGLLLGAPGGEAFTLTLQADRLIIAGAKLPRPEQTGEDNGSSSGRGVGDERAAVEHRLEMLTELDETILALFRAFLKHRFDARWPSERASISEWIRTGTRKRAAATTNGEGRRPAAEIEVVDRSQPLTPNP